MRFVVKLLLNNNTYLPDPRKSAHGSQSYWPGMKSIIFIIQLKFACITDIGQYLQKPNHS